MNDLSSKRRALAAACALALGSTLMTAPASAQLPPVSPRTQTIRPNHYFLGSGIALVAAAYAPSVVIGIASGHEEDKWLLAPIIGPWVDLGTRGGCAQGGGDCSNDQLYQFLLILSGVTQVAGAASIVAAFVVPEYRLEAPVGKSDPDGARSRRIAKPEVRITPMRLTRDGYGLGLTGRF
jgi:hypothetical protein